ncbi:MAG: iron-sulfur cluster insertion protein ErpA [Alphaproteobacteria bacterium]|nr:iron-sulfur cluster insertion protein ErpA [Alphaproteobacteria bacterium]
MTLLISDAAAERIRLLLQQEQSSESLSLRVSVSGGGCSGFQYSFVLDNATTIDDHVFEKQGASIVIDGVSLELLNGSEIDYADDLTSSRFLIKNPNATSSCGCGKSFSL